MEYEVKVTIRQDVSEKEIAERTKQFQDAFVIAAVDYYTKQKKNDEIANNGSSEN